MATETQREIAGDRPQPARVEPRYKVNQQMLEQLLTLAPTHPEYPWKYPFEKYYAASGGTPEIYPMKHAVAVALISDPQGRYKKLRFLERKFVLKGTEVTPEIQALQDDLALRVQEALLQRGAPKKHHAKASQRRQV
jgi:hypothetical protein